MSLTPLDESDTQGGESESGATESGPPGGLAGFVHRIRSLFMRTGTSLRRILSSTDVDTDRDNSDEQVSAERQETPTSSLEEPSALANRDKKPRPPVVSNQATDRSSGDRDELVTDSPELVVRWKDDRLTLSESGNSRRYISSDTWHEVER